MKTLCFITFGQVHAHAVPGKGTFDKDCVAVIECDNEEHGRQIAHEYFGDKWCFSYSREHWNPEMNGDGELEYFPRGYMHLNF